MVDQEPAQMGASTLRELIGTALACGAADVGGPLSARELALAKRATPTSYSVTRKVRAAICEGDDPLGQAFCALRSPVERRQMGAFFTNATIVTPMVEWCLAQGPIRLVDPGCGSGRFSVAAARRNTGLQIFAVDLDPVACLLTRAALAAVKAKRVRVLQCDYLSASIPLIAGRTAYVGNPPYVRHHDLDAATKLRASVLAEKIGYRISGLAGLHALFYLATLAKHGASGDVGSFVTSAEWLDVGYGSIVRWIFTNGLGGRSLLVFDPESVPFDDAMTTAAITTFQIGGAPQKARIARISSARAASALETVGRDVDRATLAEAHRWSPLLSQDTQQSSDDTIGTLFRVSRGQVTGANSFFVMTRTEARQRGIERFCVPLVSSADEIFSAAGTLRDGPERKVGLSIPKETNLAKYPALAAYLRAGEAAKVQNGYIASRRRPWYSITFPCPPIVATYMARQPPFFALNPDGLGLLNVAHGLHPRRRLSSRTLDRVVELLNAARASFVGRGRTYHGGLEKFEPREMEAIPLKVAS